MENSNLCDCNSLLSDELLVIDALSNNSDISIQSKDQHVINFGKVKIGSKSQEIVRIQNSDKEATNFAIIKDSKVNPIYQAFDFNTSYTVVDNSDYFERIITFTPKLPHEKYVDHFYIMKNGEVYLTIVLKGECTGPHVTISSSTLKFLCNDEKREALHIFEIKNTSEMDAMFQLDMSTDSNKIFKIDKTYGNITAGKHIFVNITFTPKKHGVYSYSLTCLLLYQEPIQIKLVGVYSKSKESKTELKYFSQSISETSGYTGFMYDSLLLLNTKPMFSLSECFLEFGMVELFRNKLNHKTMVTSLTNHMQFDITVTWDKGKIFRINPKKIRIPPEESVLFEVDFQPDIEDSIFSKTISGQVLWDDGRVEPDQLIVPLHISIRLLGHSFFDQTSWVPQVQMVPDTVTIPCCVPGYPSYTSFMLKATGYMPVSFKFVPPEKTNFILKPMIGMVANFQVIIAQLHVETDETKAYIERWDMELNGRSGSGIPFFIKGFCDYPSITVGKENMIRFKTMLPGAIEKELVIVSNNSTQSLQYEFHIDECTQKHLEIKHSKGELATNETISLEWYCTGSEDMPRRTNVSYSTRFLQNGKSIVGQQIFSELTVLTDCAVSALCATPNKWDVVEIHSGYAITNTFNLFNFGISPIHYILTSDDNDKILEIIPLQATVYPKQNVKVNMILKPIITGKYHINVSYKFRTFEDSSELINDSIYKIYGIDYVCRLPLMQITNIPYHNFGPLFSTINLWHLLNVANINKVMDEIKNNSSVTMDVYLPEFMESTDVRTIILSIKNMSHFQTTASLHRKKNCNCVLVETTIGMSIRKNQYDCPHRKMVQVNLSGEVFQPDMTHRMTFVLMYTLPGESTIGYTLKLSNEREIVLNIHIRTISITEQTLSTFSRNMDFYLKDVYVGELQPCWQVFWFYNNTNKAVQYHMDVREINHLRDANNFTVIRCLNPMGYVSCYRAFPIFIKFCPIEITTYKVALPIAIIDGLGMTLTLIGRGVKSAIPMEMKPRPDLHVSRLLNKVTTSMSHICVEPLTLWNQTQRVFFIRNESKEETFYYSWQTCTIGGFLEVLCTTPKGILNPKESHCITVTICSMQKPVVTHVHLACKLLSQNEYFAHKRTEAEFNLKEEELSGQFVITEAGTSKPINPLQILPPPKKFFIGVSLDIYITSIEDRDIHFKPAQQLTHHPVPTVDLRVMRAIRSLALTISDPKPAVSDRELTTISCARRSSLKMELCQELYDQTSYDVIHGVLQALLGDVLFSHLFKQVMARLKNKLPPYHVQMKLCPDKRDEAKVRDQLLINMFKQPQHDLLGQVEHDLLLDGMHNVFQLGYGGTKSNCEDDVYVMVINDVCGCKKKT